MKKVAPIIIPLLFLFATYCGCTSKVQKSTTSGPSSQRLDSLINFYNTSKKNIKDFEQSITSINQYINSSIDLQLDSLTCRGYMLKTRILGYHGYYDSALEVSELLLQLASKSSDSSYMGKAYNKLGIYTESLGKLVEAFNYYNLSFKIHRDINDSLLASKRLLVMANTQATLGDYIGSNVTAVDGLKYLAENQSSTTLLGLYHSLAISYREQKNYEQALFWNTKTINLSESSLFSKKINAYDQLKFRNTRANILSDKKEYDNSILILEKLLEDALELNDSIEYARILSNLGKIKWLKNRKNSETEKMLTTALTIRQKSNNNSDLIASHIHLAKYYANINTEKAIYHAVEAHKSASALKNKISILEALNILTTLDSTRLSSFRELKKINNALKEEQKRARQIYEPTRFENQRLTIEKEEGILQLIREKNQKRWFLVLFALLLFGILVYTYLRRRIQKEKHRLQIQKNTSEKILEIHQAENRLSKKVHDTIANKIYLVKVLIDKNIHKEEIQKKLDSIYIKARDISRENVSINFEEFDKELENMILDYKSQVTKVFIVGLETIHWNKLINIHKIIVYKVIQELMTNMYKHSEAEVTSIVFSQIEKGLEIVYTDNGVGINWNQDLKKNGISIMENRVKKIGGSFKFDTSRVSGTKIFIQIPESG
ncbi:MAG: hypothetical protein AAGB24_05710 [Bacteroidota bacterium]